MHKTKFIIIIFALSLLLLPATKVSASSSQITAEESPSEIISSINRYRGANGLYSYTQNNTLMALAQAQADYQASIGTVTHEGPGGTRPINRAYNANYGKGKKIFVSEIIYGGYQTDVSTAIEWWKNSSIHNEQMLASTYIEIGAGVATDGEWTYFVAVMGWVTGVSKPASVALAPSTSDSSNSNATEENVDVPIIIPAVPVVKATPREDGSVIHIIRSGQALWTVGVIYGVPLEEILALNGLSESAWVNPGDEILVVSPSTPTPTASRTLPPSKTPPPDKATSTATPPAIASNIERDEGNLPETESGETLNSENITAASTNNQNARWIVILSFAMLMIVIVGSMFMQKPSKRPHQHDDVVR